MSKYPFYQRLLPIETLVFVGEHDVPDGRQRQLVPAREIMPVFTTESVDLTLGAPDRTVHEYQRTKTAMGDIFVAQVNIKI